MSVVYIMKKMNLFDWYSILIGLAHGWCNKQDLIHYAEFVLLNTTGEVNDDLAIISSGENIPEEDLIILVYKFLQERDQNAINERKHEAMEKWKLAHILYLLQKDDSDEHKLAELQELYAQLGFPEDMAPCSIYNDSETDPLNEAKILKAQLLKRFCNPPS